MVVLGALAAAGCGRGGLIEFTAASSNAITGFAFMAANNPKLGGDVAAAINGTTITATVPLTTDPTALIATFSTTGTRVTVNGVVQVSGTTRNDFSRPVRYAVSGADGTIQTYTVVVAPGAPTGAELTSFAFLRANNEIASDVIATISDAKIVAMVPANTDVTRLVATFSTTGAGVSITGTPQVSGVTPNDFRAPVTYDVISGMGAHHLYTVFVEVSVGPPPMGLVTAGLEAHYDAQDAASVAIAPTNAVMQWSDVTANRNDLIMNGVGPVYSPSLINGHAGVSFTNQGGLISAAPAPLAAMVTVLFVVTWSPDNNVQDWGNLGFHENRDDAWSLEQNQRAATGYPNTVHWQTDNDNTSCDLTLVPGGSYILIATLASAATSVGRTFTAIPFADPANPLVASCNDVAMSFAPTSGSLYLGRSDAGEASNAYLGEVLYYDTVLSGSEISQDINYLEARWLAPAFAPVERPAPERSR